MTAPLDLVMPLPLHWKRLRSRGFNREFRVTFGLQRLGEVVFTTGATMNECARVLKDEGAASVTILPLARTLE
jgi:predicted amidophosphoribosyltransferase